MSYRISLFCILLNLQIISFVNSEWIVVSFHQYLNRKHIYLNSLYQAGTSYCCCNTYKCAIYDDCKMNCDTFFKVCLKESTLISETCYNTTEPTGDNTTFIPFTTPNRVQFYTNTLCETDSLLTINVTTTFNNILHTIDYYSIAINKTSPEQTIYNGSHGNSQLDLSITFSCHAINCTERDDEYGHYVCDHYGNKICKNGYINPESYCTTKIASCNSLSTLLSTIFVPLTTSTPSNVGPFGNCQDNNTFWKLIAIVSLTLCFLLVLPWVILITVLCCCKFKMKGKDDKVDTDNSSGANNVTYEQPINTKAVYVPSTIEDKLVDTYDTLFDPHPMSTVNADYSTLFDDKIYVSNDDQ